MDSYRETCLKHKYAEIPDEPRHKTKRKKAKPKKANHKHTYQNCIILCQYPKYYFSMYSTHSPQVSFNDTLHEIRASFCPICGKLNPSIIVTEEMKRLFPHIQVSYCPSGFFYRKYEEEYKQFCSWYKQHYPTFIMMDYHEKYYKGGQIFIDKTQLESYNSNQDIPR